MVNRYSWSLEDRGVFTAFVAGLVRAKEDTS